VIDKNPLLLHRTLKEGISISLKENKQVTLMGDQEKEHK